MLGFSREELLEDMCQEAEMEMATPPRGLTFLSSDCKEYTLEQKRILARIECDILNCNP